MIGRTRAVVAGAALMWLGAGAGSPLEAQAEAIAYMDPAAERLHRAATLAWDRIDDSVVRYTALVKERVGAAIRTPLKDRSLYRSESARRVFWDRDGEALIQVLAFREQTPAGVEEEGIDLSGLDGVFDPTGDRLLFGFGDQDRDYGEPGDHDFWFEHPLAGGATESYRFRSGDTLTLSFPDGRRLRAVELHVIPRVATVNRLTGSLWIEPESGALVRAVYRLSETFDLMRDVADVREEEERGEFRMVPGFLKPWTFELSMVAVDYALWDFEIWLPRSMRAEGVATAGILKMPASVDIAYQIESVVTEADLAAEAEPAEDGAREERKFATRDEAMAYLATLAGEEGVRYVPEGGNSRRRGQTTRYLVPEDRSWLRRSPHLPPPVWEDAPGFMSEAEIQNLFDELASLPAARTRTSWAANWGLERPDLVRYNRVEGLAVGARLQARVGSFLGPLSLSAEPFVGLGDLNRMDEVDVTGRGQVVHESLRRKVALGAYREIQPVSRQGRHLGLGNSVSALLFGRDDGDYFGATGADLVVTPPSAARESWRVRLYAERHRDLDVVSDFTLAHASEGAWDFRPNVEAEERDEVGAELLLAPWWGPDPLAPQAGLELYGHGAGGDGAFARAAVTARAGVPFAVSGHAFRVAAELGGGRSWGDPSPQRQWFLGGPTTLRGYPAAALTGQAFARGRLELSRTFPVGSVALFGDAGWAGADPGAFDGDDALISVGLGGSVIDGLIRLDVARGLRGPKQTRWDLYLDAAF